METTEILTENKLTCVSMFVTKLLVGPGEEKIRLSAYWEPIDVSVTDGCRGRGGDS